MQDLSVAREGIKYLYLALQKYSEGCAFFAFYVAALLFVLLKGTEEERRIFIPEAIMLFLTVFNPLFPMILNKIFDVNNEYYRFFWIAPVVILISYVFAKISTDKRILIPVFALIIIFSGNFLFKNGFIASPNIYKMPTEIPQVSEMIHEDSDGRYDGEYYPRAIFEYDYEMCMRQYDASIMLTADREAYLNAIMGNLDDESILTDENFYNRVLAVVALGYQIDPEEFIAGLENTGTEYICVSTANVSLCKYMEYMCNLRKVGETANHTLYHYDVKDDSKIFYLPDYSDVWENY